MHAKIEFETIDADIPDNLQIKLYANKYDNYSHHIQHAIDSFLSILCGMIGAKTDINYHACSCAVRGCIYIGIHQYNEHFTSTLELAQTRLNTLVKYLETLDLTQQQPYIIKSFNILTHNRVNLNTLLYASVINRVDESTYIEPVAIHMFQPVDFNRVKVKRLDFSDGSTITLINDKCASNYGVFVNLTVPFDEMGMSYNALHLYEHLMMRCFAKLSEQSLDDINGCTFPNGCCFVYTTHTTLDSMKQYFSKAVKTMIDARDLEYWNKPEQVKDIEFETRRTISETRMNRTMVDFGRSDLNAYNKGYNTDIFKYWSNKPFDIVITGKNVTLQTINGTAIQEYASKHPLNKVTKPRNVTYDKIPIDVVKSKEFDATFVQKAKADEIKKLFLNPHKNDKINVQTYYKNGLIDFGPYSYLYGIDCKLISLKESLIRYNTFLLPMVLINKLFTAKELQQMLNRSNMPTNANNYNDIKYFG